ncbi:hypothetical protein DOFOFD_05200 [Acetobacteraceae bacterium EV16P]|uniref:Uncharacterized protein n=1 Tax=Sorlinia euscelidii TaxID=3081148 RepID=A0ABU7U1N6_9PROT
MFPKSTLNLRRGAASFPTLPPRSCDVLERCDERHISGPSATILRLENANTLAITDLITTVKEVGDVEPHFDRVMGRRIQEAMLIADIENRILRLRP